MTNIRKFKKGDKVKITYCILNHQKKYSGEIHTVDFIQDEAVYLKDLPFEDRAWRPEELTLVTTTTTTKGNDTTMTTANKTYGELVSKYNSKTYKKEDLAKLLAAKETQTPDGYVTVCDDYCGETNFHESLSDLEEHLSEEVLERGHVMDDVRVYQVKRVEVETKFSVEIL